MSEDLIVAMFNKMTAAGYDEYNSHFQPIVRNFLFLIRLVLQDLPTHARILCVGAGTGTEILELATVNPGWTFCAVEPSDSMLTGCRAKLTAAGVIDRCELIQGKLADVSATERFDAVLCLLVLHFIRSQDERVQMLEGMYARLLPNGYLINAEISHDMSAADFPLMMANWKAMHSLAGADEANLVNVENSFRKVLGVLSPSKTEEMLRNCGFADCLHFFQSLFIHAWVSRRRD